MTKPQSRRPRDRRLAVLSLLLLVPVLGACGFNVQSDKVYQAAAGTNSRLDHVNSTDAVDILNSTIVTKKDGVGVWAGSLTNQDQTKPDQLVSVSDATLTDGVVTIPPADLVNLGAAGGIVVKSSKVVPGNYVTLKFTFASGQVTKLATPVVPWSPSGDYSAVPMPTPQAKATGPKKAQPTKTATSASSPSSEG